VPIIISMATVCCGSIRPDFKIGSDCGF
jgi:hypothetical protein